LHRGPHQYFLKRGATTIQLPPCDTPAFWHVLEWLAADALRRRYGVVIGLSSQMWHVCRQIEAAAQPMTKRYHMATLLVGPDGTGKRRLSEAIHRLTMQRRPLQNQYPITRVDCADNLAAVDLWGSKNLGIFPDGLGAASQAQMSTLCLDSLHALEAPDQLRLLHLLSDGLIQPCGSEKPTQRLNVNLLATTNCDLSSMVTNGTFRKDLLYRIFGIVISLPSLAERREDIPFLLSHLLQEAGVSLQPGYAVYQAVLQEKNSLATIAEYSWPGNTPELRLCIQRSRALPEGENWDGFWRNLVGCIQSLSGVEAPQCGLKLTLDTSAFSRRRWKRLELDGHRQLDNWHAVVDTQLCMWLGSLQFDWEGVKEDPLLREILDRRYREMREAREAIAGS
jgi:transcriptional regulator with AAA-type ATPase domain